MIKAQKQHHVYSVSAFQLSQSAYMPLQLPYSVFGLGQTPNFVDTLEVGIPTNTSVSYQILRPYWSVYSVFVL
jgi:hypothetical protein